jgi:hypothetical protein
MNNALLFASELFSNRAVGQFLTEIPIAVTGSWVKDGHRFSITKEDLDDIVENFQKRGNGQVVVDFEHASERPEVARGGPVPAAGWINALDVREKEDGQGHALWGDVEFTDDTKDLIKKNKYRYFSPAIDWGAADKKTGRAKGATITSAALTNHPFLEELPAITLSEKSGKVVDKMVPGAEAGRSEGTLKDKAKLKIEQASDVSLDQTRVAVTNAIQKTYGGSSLSPLGTFCWVKDFFDTYAIVENDGKLYRIDYDIDGTGNVELSKPTEVQISYEEVPMQQQFRDKKGDEVERKPSADDQEQFQVDGLRPGRGGREEATRRAGQIDEPGTGGGTDVLDATELRDSGANLPRLRLKKMSTGNHAVINTETGRIHGFVSNDDLTAHAKRSADEGKPAAREVMTRTKKLMESPGNETLSYSRAHAQVLMSDENLAERYHKEHTKVLL